MIAQTCIVKSDGEGLRPDLSALHKAHLGGDAEGRCRVNDRAAGVNYVLTGGGEEEGSLSLTRIKPVPQSVGFDLLRMRETFRSPTEAEVSLHSHVTDVSAT